MLKPWPNAIPRNLKPTRVKLSTWSKLGTVWSPTWLALDRAFLHLIKLKFSPNSSQGVHHLATSKQVALLLLGDGAVVVSKLNGFLPSWLDLTVPPARFDFVTWLELARVGSTVWPGLRLPNLTISRLIFGRFVPRIEQSEGDTEVRERGRGARG